MDVLKLLRKRVLELLYYGCDGNIQSIFSALEIIWVLYDQILHITPENYRDPDRNYFVLSKGQAVPGLHAVLERKGFFKSDELNGICGFNSRFSVQADRSKFDGLIETSGGSLGHGLPMAVGIALAARITGSPSKVFVLTGDGEFNEGTMWESALLASSKKLDNLCIIIDDNNSIRKMIDMGNFEEKLNAFGFQTLSIDGHNTEEIKEALLTASKKRPMAVIARTIRGYGSKTLMEDDIWFHKAPNKEELALLCREVDEFEKRDVRDGR